MTEGGVEKKSAGRSGIIIVCLECRCVGRRGFKKGHRGDLKAEERRLVLNCSWFLGGEAGFTQHLRSTRPARFLSLIFLLLLLFFLFLKRRTEMAASPPSPLPGSVAILVAAVGDPLDSGTPFPVGTSAFDPFEVAVHDRISAHVDLLLYVCWDILLVGRSSSF